VIASFEHFQLVIGDLHMMGLMESYVNHGNTIAMEASVVVFLRGCKQML